MRIISSMPKSEILKKFIVLEGLDGAGTTTQLKRLTALFEEHSIPCTATFEPSDGPIGLLLRSVLKGEHAMDPATVALLFAADRREHIYGTDSGIKSRLEAGDYVICDRYLFSSLAYQSIGAGYEYVFGLNRDYPLPEFLVFVDVSPEECVNRRAGRGGREIFDDIEVQRRVLEFYEKTMRDLSDPGMKVLRVDGNRGIDEILSEIWSFIRPAPIK